VVARSDFRVLELNREAFTQLFCEHPGWLDAVSELLATPVREPRRPAARPRFYEDTDTRIGVPHFLATQYLRTKGIKPQFPNGIVSSVSFVSTTNTARSLAGFVLLALALTPWRSPGSSEKLCPAM
jgi:CRP-like cAMP-binding protein